VLLDQVRFEDQRMGLGRHDDRLEAADVLHQRARLDAFHVLDRDVAANP
jgi:hypothetical protein